MAEKKAGNSRQPSRIAFLFDDAKPIDIAFALLASLCIIFSALWLCAFFLGRHSVEIPKPLTNLISGSKKYFLGAGTAGTLALRKWFYKTPAPNYIPHIVLFTGCETLLVVLFGVLFFRPVQVLVPGKSVLANATPTIEPRPAKMQEDKTTIRRTRPS